MKVWRQLSTQPLPERSWRPDFVGPMDGNWLPIWRRKRGMTVWASASGQMAGGTTSGHPAPGTACTSPKIKCEEGVRRLRRIRESSQPPWWIFFKCINYLPMCPGFLETPESKLDSIMQDFLGLGGGVMACLTQTSPITASQPPWLPSILHNTACFVCRVRSSLPSPTRS